VLLLVRGRRDGAPAPLISAQRDALPAWLLLVGVAVVEVAVTPLLPLPDVLEMHHRSSRHA
jgi:hypothetical protein